MNKRAGIRLHLMACALALPLALGPRPAFADGVEDLLWPRHIAALAEAEAELTGLIALHMDTSADAKAMWDLFNAPPAPLPNRLSLEGRWRVRSLQIRQDAVNIYGFFPCELRREGATGLVLDKTSGSQKRLGLILDDRIEDAFVFVGGSYTTGEPARNYSGFAVDDVKAPGSHLGIDMSADSVGLVRSLGRDHLLIIFASNDGRSEMYELKR
ncbi:MAG: DUF4893 domain-containing protein [Rhizobiaceae bacterium]|nr:DUF4893 domain-containing protein [Rhizobiaceae bacterium]